MAQPFDKVPKSFTAPELLPRDPEEAKQWQEANRSFWETSAMRYDWKQRVPHEEFSPAFFKEIDARFFANARDYLPWKALPFDTLIDFDSLKQKAVLEIGTGMGSHAQLLASHAHSYTGIDITSYAVKATTERFKVFGLQGDILQMDAEEMDFPPDHFDFVWSWGVIHHSSNTERILRQIGRVLKPRGEAVIMVYHRGWWNYYVVGAIGYGVGRGGFLKTGSLARSIQINTDGALARYYTSASWSRLVEPYLKVESIKIMGQKTDLFPMPYGSLKNLAMRATPTGLTRFLTNRLGMGGFLISALRKEYAPLSAD